MKKITAEMLVHGWLYDVGDIIFDAGRAGKKSSRFGAELYLVLAHEKRDEYDDDAYVVMALTTGQGELMYVNRRWANVDWRGAEHDGQDL